MSTPTIQSLARDAARKIDRAFYDEIMGNQSLGMDKADPLNEYKESPQVEHYATLIAETFAEVGKKIALLDDPSTLHYHCVRHLTDAQVAHLFGERMTTIQNDRDSLRTTLTTTQAELATAKATIEGLENLLAGDMRGKLTRVGTFPIRDEETTGFVVSCHPEALASNPAHSDVSRRCDYRSALIRSVPTHKQGETMNDTLTLMRNSTDPAVPTQFVARFTTMEKAESYLSIRGFHASLGRYISASKPGIYYSLYDNSDKTPVDPV